MEPEPEPNIPTFQTLPMETTLKMNKPEVLYFIKKGDEVVGIRIDDFDIPFSCGVEIKNKFTEIKNRVVNPNSHQTPTFVNFDYEVIVTIRPKYFDIIEIEKREEEK